MKTIPKLLTFMALLSIINFANASSLEKAYADYRIAYNTNKGDENTSSALTNLENVCETSCDKKSCKDGKVAKDCITYCGYVPECSVAQGLKKGEEPYKAHLASLGITTLDDNSIPNMPLPQEPSIASKSSESSSKQANGSSPTEVIIKIVVDNPTAASCKPVVINKDEASQFSAPVHSIARPLAASTLQHQEVAHSQPSAAVAAEASPVVEQPVTPQPAKSVCIALLKIIGTE